MAPTCGKKCATLPRVPAFDHANPWEGLRVGAENVQLYLAFSRSTTPIHCNFRYITPNGWKKMQLYLAFLRSTMPIHGKGCAWRRKCATLPRVSVARPRQSIVRAAIRHADRLEKDATLPRVQCVRPCQSMGRVARHADMLEKMCKFTSRSVRSTTPIHCKGSIHRADRLEKDATLPRRVPAFDHANPWEGLRVAPTRCHFTTRSRARPRQSMVRVAFPIG